MEADNQVFRATITVGEPASASIIGLPFNVTWQPPGTPEPPARLETENVTRLAAFFEKLPSGKIDFQMIREAAPDLRYLLGTSRLGVVDLFELAANGTTTVLTDIPWESAAIGAESLPDDTGALFERLLASLPVCRLVPASSPGVVIGECRPRVMLCISNPPGIDGGQILIGPIETACEQALQLYPVFQLRKLRGPLIWPTVNSEIRRFRPNILILVGHGSSPAGENPTLAFVRVGDKGGVDRRPVAELGESLALAKSCCLVALFACDLVRTSGYSAACELVRHGLGEVLAMQGSVEQQCARVALVEVLSQLVAGAPLPAAAAAARRACSAHPHAILPAVFRASDRNQNASELAALSALYSQALGSLYARVSETRPMLKRAVLQRSVEQLLSGAGVAAVTGPFGNGSSTVLRAAVAAVLEEPVGRKSRPVLYIDCDRRPGHLPLSDWVSDQLAAAINPHPVLRPLNASAFVERTDSGEKLGAFAVEAEISIVLDNLPLLVTSEDKAFVEGFASAYRRPDSHACLLLAGGGELVDSANAMATVNVLPLSLDETEVFANELIPGANGQELYQRNGGTLLLLDEERRRRTQSGRPTKMLDGDRSILELYLERLEEWLSPEAQEAAARLAFFPYPIALRIVQELVMPDLPHAPEVLLDAGLAMSFEDNTITWLLIPDRKSDAIRTRKSDDNEKIGQTLAKWFLERYDKSRDETIRTVTELPGASEYLKIVQLCLVNIDRIDAAVFLPLGAQGTRINASGLFELFKQSVQILDLAGTNDQDILAEIFLAGSKVALNIGESETAEQWFLRIPEKLDRILECRRLGLKAAILKDKRQASALDEILQCFVKAAELVSDVPPEQQGEFNELRRELAFDSLPTALFLNREPAESAAKRLESIFPLVSQQEKGQLLATLAEREMKEPKPNWRRVADWVTEAASAVENGSDERARTYCLYQQAQYLKLRPEPRYPEAWKTYQKSWAVGKLAGEPRREGLALLRIIELERDSEQLRKDPSTWPTQRLIEVDTIAARLRPAKDALSSRALGRLQSVSASLEHNLDSRRERLTQAARAFSVSALSSRTDDRHFAEVCLQALELDLQPTGDFLLLQRFLSSFRFEIKRRFGIDIDLDKPEVGRVEIEKQLGELSSQGGQHG
jgi:hypothetical protein